jgi:uncharacterized protein
MKCVLNKKIKNPTIIEGFPGIGLVGTIATEFLITATKAKEIGYIQGNGVPPMIAIHNGKLSRPMGIYYSEKNNLLIIHFLSAIPGKEWEIADIILELYKSTGAKEIISLESVGSPGKLGTKPNSYVYSSKTNNKLSKLSKPLSNGIVMGITGILMGKSELNLSCIFGETHTRLPDSKSAAGILEILNSYLGLKIDLKPLKKSAEEFENKLNDLISSSQKVQKDSSQKSLSYMG